jgi:hypothetical protein
MGHQYVITEPPIADNAQRFRPRAEMFLTGRTGLAGVTPDPWIDHARVPHFNATGFGTESDNGSGNLVSERQRQLPALRQIKALTAPHVEESIAKMEIAMTDTTRVNMKKHLRPPGFRSGILHSLQWLPKLCQLIAVRHRQERCSPAAPDLVIQTGRRCPTPS